MIFLGKRFWTEEIPVFPLLEHLMSTGRYKNLLLSLTDSPTDILKTLEDFGQQDR